MKIYSPRATDGFEWALPVDADDAERLLTMGTAPLAANWMPISVDRITADEGKHFAEADLPWLGKHVLVMRERARDVLGPVLGDDVELLPMRSTDGVDLWVTHALRIEPVLDLEASELKRFASSGRIMRILRHEFLRSAEQAGPAFRLEAMPRGSLFVTEPVVAAALGAGLTGASFDLLWSSDDPAD